MTGDPPIIAEIARADAATITPDWFAACHDRLRAADPTCVAIAAALLAAGGVAADRPIARAALLVAATADVSGRGNPFHNPAHAREVCVNWWLLWRIAPIGDPDLLPLGLVAALGHDLAHDGRGNMAGGIHIPFRHERVAAGVVGAMLAHSGAAAATDAITAMILTTDVEAGYRALADPAGARWAAPLRADPRLLDAARRLRDADLLPSAGTSVAAYRARTTELERELGLAAGRLGGAAAAGFFERIVGHRFLSEPAQRFTPTLRAIEAIA